MADFTMQRPGSLTVSLGNSPHKAAPGAYTAHRMAGYPSLGMSSGANTPLPVAVAPVQQPLALAPLQPNGPGALTLVSLGCSCGPKMAFQEMKLDKETLPFDWMCTTIQGIIGFLSTDFQGFFQFNSRDGAILPESTRPIEVFRTARHSWWHDDPTDPATQEKFIRRIDRLNTTIRAVNEAVLFVRVAATTDELPMADVLLHKLAEKFGPRAMLLLIVGGQVPRNEGAYTVNGIPNLLVFFLHGGGGKSMYCPAISAAIGWASGQTLNNCQQMQDLGAVKNCALPSHNGFFGMGNIPAFDNLPPSIEFPPRLDGTPSTNNAVATAMPSVAVVNTMPIVQNYAVVPSVQNHAAKASNGSSWVAAPFPPPGGVAANATSNSYVPGALTAGSISAPPGVDPLGRSRSTMPTQPFGAGAGPPPSVNAGRGAAAGRASSMTRPSRVANGIGGGLAQFTPFQFFAEPEQAATSSPSKLATGLLVPEPRPSDMPLLTPILGLSNAASGGPGLMPFPGLNGAPILGANGGQPSPAGSGPGGVLPFPGLNGAPTPWATGGQPSSAGGMMSFPGQSSAPIPGASGGQPSSAAPGPGLMPIPGLSGAPMSPANGGPLLGASGASSMPAIGDQMEVWSASFDVWCPATVKKIEGPMIHVHYRNPLGQVMTKGVPHGHSYLRPAVDVYSHV